MKNLNVERDAIPLAGVYSFWGKASPLNQSNYKYWQLFYSGNRWALPWYSKGKWTFGDKPWDSGPGSKFITVENAFVNKNVDIPMMVTPLSVMDVSTNYFTGANFFSYNRNISKGKNYFISNGYTNLDEVYSINVNGQENMRHPFVYQEDIIRDIILDQELMVTDYYLQNRTFDKDRDIECGGSMVVGRDVLPQDRYLYEDANYNQNGINLNTTETEKTQANGDVVINSGINLNLEAKNEITFKTGFNAKSGSHFTAKVDGTDPNKRSDEILIEPCGQINLVDVASKTYALSYSENTVWVLRGYNYSFTSQGNKFEIPSENIRKGQYSLHARIEGCLNASVVVSIENLERVTTKKQIQHENLQNNHVQVFPNPTSNNVYIRSKIMIENIELSDVFGKQLFQRKVDNYETFFETSSFSNGTYYLKVKLLNKEYYAEKIVVID